MALPVRRQRTGTMAELGFPGWTRETSAEFDDLFTRMSRLFEATAGPRRAAERMWVPQADLRETEDAYLVEVELPGVKREDVDVEIDDRELIISGEIKEHERPGVLRRSTRRSGRYELRLRVGSDVNADAVRASLQEGVLMVTVPKVAAAKPHHVEITSGT